MSEKQLLILIDDGETFMGTLEQFKDCFFDNADKETIEIWAKENGYKIQFEEIYRYVSPSY